MDRTVGWTTGLLVGLLLGSAAYAAESRPNIIFIYSDDHTAQAVGAYQGHLDYGLRLDHSPTPNIDRLAQQGMRFDNAFVTNSICRPSRAAVLTGRFGHETGVTTNGKKIDPELLTFPKVLQNQGYQTAIVGKWHLRTEPQGFDYYEVLNGQGPYYNPGMRTKDGRVNHKGYTTEVISEQTMEWLKEGRAEDEPFLLMMQHKAPHRRWLPGPRHANDYAGRKLPEPDTLFYDYWGLTSPASNQAMEIGDHMRWGGDLKISRHPESGKELRRYPAHLEPAYRPMNEWLLANYDDLSEKEITRWKYQRYIKDYLRTIQGIDDTVGRVMRYLRSAGLADNTIVVYTADQGFFLGENGWFDKRWMYEESLRVPLIVRWPGEVDRGSVDEHLVQNSDFAPTFLDLAGADVPDKVQGRSFAPLLQGKDPANWRDAIYYQYWEYPGAHSVRRHYGIRTQRYKLMHFHRVGTWEMFDLKKDPEELHSVYGDNDYTKVQKRLKKKLKQLQKQYDSPWLSETSS